MAKIVHVVFNAHIDPIWLWPWQSGLDEVLATCRSACDRLDRHPDLTFSRGEAWVYDQIEKIDPGLFDRIHGHVLAGRWEVVGGWWLQPDCNAPSGFAMERQIGLGKDYFESRFGDFPRIAYNVDSFGHAATLPSLMREFGQDRYVMMRPQPHEMALPACLFRWQGYADGPEVVTFRIPRAYTTGHGMTEEHVRAAVAELPDGTEHTMFFAGFGDHGGGPTERQIAWFRQHQTAFDGIEMVFSSPRRFFDAIWAQRQSLPLVTGELQQHAIGCYSVYRPIKTALRKAEHRLRQAEIFCEREVASVPVDTAPRIEESWKRVCFNHFHDTLGGTCLPSAYEYPLAQLGYAWSEAEELLQEGLRRKLRELPDDPMQRIVLYNASDLEFDGPVEFTPWLDWESWKDEWALIDEDGAAVPFQVIAPEALSGNMANLLFWMKVPAGGMRVLRIALEGGASSATEASNTVDVFGRRRKKDGSFPLSDEAMMAMMDDGLFDLEIYDDASDTWSHGLDRYSDAVVAKPCWGESTVVEKGPIRWAWIRSGTIGNSMLTAELRAYSPHLLDIVLTVHWNERHKLLKLVQGSPFTFTYRVDGVLGGWVERALDGRELPLQNGMITDSRSDEDETVMRMGIVSPDVYAADATPERIRFTLLRSAIMAHHDPHNGEGARRTFSDQGVHQFRFRFLTGDTVTPELVERHAAQMQRPLIVADLTRGMGFRMFDRV